MLTGITLKDYTTFIKEKSFDFKATNYKILEDTNVGDNRVLKGALFMGENASGKTQVLNSITLLLNLLLSNAEQNFAIKKSLYTKGTKFSLAYTFDVKGVEIKYSVIFNGNTIWKEELYVDGQLKLDRLNTSGHTNFGNEKSVDEINPSLSLLKLEYYNTKFNNDPILNEWFDFLKNSLYINCLKCFVQSFNPAEASKQLIKKYAEEKDATNLNKLLAKLGYNSEIVFDKQASNKDKTMIISYEKNVINLKKKGTDAVIPINFESAGNQALVHIILPFEYATKNNCMLIVDEFSSGLHNELEETLIRYFFNNSKNSQIFFTSHSTNLLDTSILRPDQIYSFRFDSKEGTLIKRVSDENPRESQNIEKMYLNGVFDGLPKYNKEIKN
ncbi:MAG: AAA family ATPase [bacterium]|nr:AAA family ATPase [bacterium]